MAVNRTLQRRLAFGSNATLVTVSLLSRPTTVKSVEGVVPSKVTVAPYVLVLGWAVIVNAAGFTVSDPVT